MNEWLFTVPIQNGKFRLLPSIAGFKNKPFLDRPIESFREVAEVAHCVPPGWCRNWFFLLVNEKKQQHWCFNGIWWKFKVDGIALAKLFFRTPSKYGNHNKNPVFIYENQST